MKKIVCVILILVISVVVLCGCGEVVGGPAQESANNTEHQMLLNHGSCFVYVFEDSETGVWYIATDDGLTPRLNADGSLYTTTY